VDEALAGPDPVKGFPPPVGGQYCVPELFAHGSAVIEQAPVVLDQKDRLVSREERCLTADLASEAAIESAPDQLNALFLARFETDVAA
jgi:hypothetical protein